MQHGARTKPARAFTHLPEERKENPMATQNQNGRNVVTPDENRPSWRPQDQMYRGREDERWRDRDERDRDEERGSMQRGGQMGSWDERDERYRSMERYGQGQGFGGRYGEERPMHRGQSYMGQDEYRGGQGHWMERQERGWGRGDDRMRWREREGELGGRGFGGYGGPGFGQEHMGYGGYGQDYGEQRFGGQGYRQHGQGYGQEYGEHRYGGQGSYGQRGQGYGEQRFGGQGYGEHRFGGQGYGGQGYGEQRFGGRGFGQSSHRGKGPMGYTRSDERIRENVCEALTDDDNLDASQIEVTVRNGEVILSGSVEERQDKRLAEDVVERVPGVKDVQNQIKVQERRERGNQGGTQQVHKSEVETSTDKSRHRA